MWTNNIRKKTKGYRPNFYDWLEMPLCDVGGAVKKSSGGIKTHEDYVNFFLETIEKILLDNAYQINDIIKFREDIARYIYTLSDNC